MKTSINATITVINPWSGVPSILHEDDLTDAKRQALTAEIPQDDLDAGDTRWGRGGYPDTNFGWWMATADEMGADRFGMYWFA